MQISLSRRGMVTFDASAFSTKEEREMLYAISKLDVSYNSIAVVKGMQCLNNLTALDISYNKVKSLAGLPLKLRRLNVSNNELKYIDGLTPLSQLEWIDVSHNELLSLAGLPGTQVLRHVDASHNRIGNLKGIELCTAVHELHITHNLLRKVEDLVPLRYLRSLKQLDVGENPVAANPRNFTAIRLLVPFVNTIEGANAAAAALANASSRVSGDQSTNNSALTAFASFHSLNPTPGNRPRTPTSRPTTPNTSSIAGNVSSAPSTPGLPPGSRPKSPLTSSQPVSVKEPLRRTHSASSALEREHSSSSSRATAPSAPYAGLNETAPLKKESSQALYHSLLKSIESSRSSSHKSPFTSSPFTTTTALASADGQQRSRSAEAVPSSRGRASPSRSQPTGSGTSLLRPIQNSVDLGRPEQDASVATITAQRLQQQKIEELDKLLRQAQKERDDARREADSAKLQVKQLKETVERQAKVNAMLADANRQLSIEASRLQLGAPPKVTLVLPVSDGTALSGPSAGRSGSIASSASSLRSGEAVRDGAAGGRPATPDGNAKASGSLPPSPKQGPTTPILTSPRNAPSNATNAIGSYASKRVQSPQRGSISGGGKKTRRADMSPKRGSLTSDVREMVPQSGVPLSFPVPAGGERERVLATPREPNRSSFAAAPKNVSFGGAQFYSPPQHY